METSRSVPEQCEFKSLMKWEHFGCWECMNGCEEGGAHGGEVSGFGWSDILKGGGGALKKKKTTNKKKQKTDWQHTTNQMQ